MENLNIIVTIVLITAFVTAVLLIINKKQIPELFGCTFCRGKSALECSSCDNCGYAYDDLGGGYCKNK